MNRYRKYTTTSRFSRSSPWSAVQANNPDLPQDSPLLKVESKGNWLPIFAVSIYFASLWKPPIITMPSFRWYFVLGLALFAFVLLKKPLNIRALQVFWTVYGLGFLGAVLSLVRASNLELSLWNTVGMGISFVSYLLFLPVLSLRRTRYFFMFLLIGIGILWAMEIQRLSAQHGTLYLGTFGETGEDKNHIGFVLSMASVALLYLSIFWRQSDAKPKRRFSILRLSLGLISIFMIYNMVIIYARSAILATALGVCVVLSIILVKNPGQIGRSRVVVVIIIISASIMLLVPKVLAVSPEWNRLSNYETDGLSVINTYEIRTVLINKGLFIVKENPLIGVGAGGSRLAIDSSQYYFPYYLIHNTFLTDWAEKGILGILSDVIWIFAYIKIFRKEFFNLHVIDQAWLVLFIPLFFDMNFLDMSSISIFMLAILTGISMERYQLNQVKRPLPDVNRLMGQGRL